MSDAYGEYEERVRKRAHEIWEREGKPEGRADDNWALAKEEVSTEENIETTLKSPEEREDGPEEFITVEGQADIPGRLNDQGERPDYPSPPKRTRAKQPTE